MNANPKETKTFTCKFSKRFKLEKRIICTTRSVIILWASFWHYNTYFAEILTDAIRLLFQGTLYIYRSLYNIRTNIRKAVCKNTRPIQHYQHVISHIILQELSLRSIILIEMIAKISSSIRQKRFTANKLYVLSRQCDERPCDRGYTAIVSKERRICYRQNHRAPTNNERYLLQTQMEGSYV